MRAARGRYVLFSDADLSTAGVLVPAALLLLAGLAIGEAAVEHDEQLLEHYLGGAELSDEEIDKIAWAMKGALPTRCTAVGGRQSRKAS